MKVSQTKRYATALAIATLAAIATGCGGGNNGAPVIPPPPGGINYGIGGGGTAICTTGGIPLSQVMSFSGVGAYADTQNLYVGSTSGGYAGQVQVTPGGAIGGAPLVNNIMPPSQGSVPRQTSWIQYLGVALGGTGYGYTGGSYSISGSFQFSQLAWSYLTSVLSGYSNYALPYSNPGYSYNPYTMGQYGGQYGTMNACVTGPLSIDSGIYMWGPTTTQGTLYGGTITLSINGQIGTFPI
jgi:hypothetical protein